ncbi:MAG: 3-methyl-2-oxobutanoate hydroxymethyltransferase [Verrucomicrobiota bacterium]
MSPKTLDFADRLEPPISAITAYDYPSARLCDEAGIQLLLVGDSLGMVVAGNPDTTSVTLDQMVYHTEMVARGTQRAIVVADLPIGTYENPEAAYLSAKRLIEAGADAVKLEGGLGQLAKIRRLILSGIPVCAHIGMLPQRVVAEGGYRKKGKSETEARELVRAASELEAVGAFAIVLESMVAEVAEEITKAISIPTIGIGSGEACDGQIRVFHDVVGAYPWFVPPFAKVYADVAGDVLSAVERYRNEIEASD